MEPFRLRRSRRRKLTPELVHISSCPCKAHAADRELHVSHLRFGLERVIGNLLIHVGTLIGFRDGRLRQALVGHHADRQQNAKQTGKAKLVAEAVELDGHRRIALPMVWARWCEAGLTSARPVAITFAIPY